MVGVPALRPETFSRLFPKNHRARTRKTEAIKHNPVPGAERYAVAVREGSGWRTFTYDCRGTSYTATGLSNGTEYEFLVQALCMGRWSSFGEGDVVSVIPADPTAPEARVESTGDGTVTLSWGAVVIPSI